MIIKKCLCPQLTTYIDLMQKFCDYANGYLNEINSIDLKNQHLCQNKLVYLLKTVSTSYEMREFLGEEDGMIGGTWGSSWKSQRMMHFFEVLQRMKVTPGCRIPVCTYIPSMNPMNCLQIRKIIIWRFFEESTQQQRQSFWVLFNDESRVLNDVPSRSENPKPTKNVRPSSKSPGILWVLNRETNNFEPYTPRPSIRLEQLPVA
jgi:hypothetical protein